MGLLQGIWWGMILGVLVQTATLIILTARTNWDAEVIETPDYKILSYSNCLSRESMKQFVMQLQVEKAVARIKRSAEDETLDHLIANA